MPHSLEEINSLRSLISALIFGTKPDRILDSINNFMLHFENLHTVLSKNHFPKLILHLLYYPLFLTVMILNCLREAIMWWITVIVLFLVFCAIIGAVATLGILGYRGYEIYQDRFDSDGLPKEKDAKNEKAKPEGGSRESDN